MTERGLSARGLAKELNLHRDTVAGLLRGNRKTHSTVVLAICSHLGLSTTDLGPAGQK